MKNLGYYNGLKEKEAFQEFLNSLQRSITTWEYFVDWEKVLENATKYNTELNILNSLIGSSNIEKDFINICKRYPEVKKALPILIAVRRKKLRNLPLLLDSESLKISEVDEIFEQDNKDYNKLLKFFNESGLKKIFEDRKVRNLIDYTTGVEVGMDTHGRKNRTGNLMENLVKEEIDQLCKKKGYQYEEQVTAKQIKKLWGIDIPTNKARKRFDFVIKAKEKITLFEVNFYREGGSKLEATSGEYIKLNETLEKNGFRFIWITDGLGWLSSSSYLEEAFLANDYVFNLKMIKGRVLEEVL